MYSDKLMTQEEQEAVVRRIWDEKKQDILKSVEYAINQEMGLSMGSMAKKLVQEELRGLLALMIESKKEQLQKAAEKIVDRLSSRLEEAIYDQMREAFSNSYTQSVNDMMGYLGGKLRSVMEKVLTYDRAAKKLVEVEVKDKVA